MAPRPLTLALAAGAAGAAALAKRAARRRIERSPLWPMPTLAEPVSGQGRARGMAPVAGRGATAARRLALVVAERTEPADGVVQLRLEAPDGAPLPPWQPGAHLDVVLPSGLVRQYSLCGDPADAGAYTVATRLVEGGRGGSREVHERLRDGVRVEVRGPRNRFPLVASRAHLFVVGGIGITPVLPMLRALAAAGADWRLLYCGRSRASMPFLDEVEELGADGGRVTVVAGDADGRPTLDFLTSVSAETAVYCCGPTGLMDAVARLLPEGRALHLERFAASTDVAAPGAAFDVELHRSGRVVHVEADQSVLAAVRTALPDVAYSCQQGFCGTCQQTVLAGEVDHRDDLLTDAERDDSMLICVSRCRGRRLVLDL
ncbi:PDR/VanB family oxidoreductase [Streptomyces sp. NPDC020412]|uniref:PDR/VanB family oxidoreductase n=1 Tax=Streptomyces sp. NPDC020412 TaxID=3365073 RepID=UPI00379381D1